MSKATGGNYRWSQKIWREWMVKYNDGHPSSQCPPDILEKASSPEELQPWLIEFIMSFKESEGKVYRKNTLNAVLVHLHRHVKLFNPHHEKLKFLDRPSNIKFKLFTNCLHDIYQYLDELSSAERRKINIFTQEDEDTLWDKQVLGVDSPLQLLRSVYFYNGKHLMLRSGEHRQLRFSQFRRLPSDCYEFIRFNFEDAPSDTENSSLDPKSVIYIHANPFVGNRCHVSLLDKYISMVPPTAYANDCFYLQPIKTTVDVTTCSFWYIDKPYGKSTLNNVAKTIAAEAGITGHFTTTSIQQTGRVSHSSSICNATRSIKTVVKFNNKLSTETKADESGNSEEEEQSITQILPSESPEMLNLSPHSLEGLHLDGVEVSLVRNIPEQSTVQELSIGNCEITIRPTCQFSKNILTSCPELQGINKGVWQVVLYPPTQSDDAQPFTTTETCVYGHKSIDSYSPTTPTTVFEYVCD